MPRTPLRRLALAVLLVSAVSRADPRPLIPRRTLLSSATASHPVLSPDGRRLAWVEGDDEGTQIWVQTLGTDEFTAVVENQDRAIHSLHWVESSRALLFTQDLEGGDKDHLFLVDLQGKVKDLTPYPGVRATLMSVSSRNPGQVLVRMNRDDRSRMDVFRIDLASGAVKLEVRNPGAVLAWASTEDLLVKARLSELPDGSRELAIRDRAGGPWRTLTRAGPDDQLRLVGLGPEGKSVVYVSSAGSETGRVVERPLDGGKEKVLASHPAVDPGRVGMHPSRHVVQGVVFEVDRPAWTLLDPTVKKDFDVLAHIASGLPVVVSRDRADKTWVVVFEDPQRPGRVFLFDRTSLQGKPVLPDFPRLDLAPLEPVRFPARDGLTIHGYLTRPVGATGPGPLVLLPRIWPGTRDPYRFNALAQLFADRGYSVLQLNPRGSSGYGRTYLDAGNRQIGGAIRTDLLDAVDWAAKTGVAEPGRVCIYGGYWALAAAAFSPEVFRCVVERFGPLDLITYLRSEPPYQDARGQRDRRLGNPEDPRDRAVLEAASPLGFVDRIRSPMLIAQGGKDTRVPAEDTGRLVKALERNGVPVTLVLYPDEANDFGRWQNVVDFLARAEAFLAEHLGGRAEPVGADRVAGSSAEVKVAPARPAAAPASVR